MGNRKELTDKIALLMEQSYFCEIIPIKVHKDTKIAARKLVKEIIDGYKAEQKARAIKRKSKCRPVQW